MNNNSPSELRKVYFDAFQKKQRHELLTAMESIIVDVIERHPEYQPLFENEQNFQEWQHERFQINGNPFFHMGLHIAIIEQVSIDRPAGVKDIYQRLYLKYGDQTRVEHKMMDCLARFLAESFNSPEKDNERGYLEALKRLI